MLEPIYYCTSNHPFAQLLIARDSQGVCALLLGDSQQALVTDLQARFTGHPLVKDKVSLQEYMQKVERFIQRPDHSLQLPLSLHGTKFQLSVWEVLQQIPPGTTRSYSQIATTLGQPKATRAVANACAKNPVALVVACHRVLRSDGGISGYRWGVARKLTLLELEKRYCGSRGA